MPNPTPRLTSLAPQFLVDDLPGAIALNREVLGFAFDAPFGGFHAIGRRDGFELHLKEAPKTAADHANRQDHQHLDAYAGVDGIDALHMQCASRGARILKPLGSG